MNIPETTKEQYEECLALPYCLHLWCRIEGDGLLPFGKWGTI